MFSWEIYYTFQNTLHKKCLYLEFFWFIFSRIWTEYGDLGLCIQPENGDEDQKNYEYEYFSRSDNYW